MVVAQLAGDRLELFALRRREDVDEHRLEIFDVAPPFLMWRALVVANPAFYPQLSAQGRDRLLGFATEVLEQRVLDPSWAEELFH